MKIYLPTKEILPIAGYYTLLWGDKDGNLKEVQHVKNLITQAAKNSWAKHHRGFTANNQGIGTYHALGLDATAPALGDTQLGNELFRKLISVRDDVDNISRFQTFFTTDEGNGDLKEVGLFGDDADGTADSGTLFSHLAINRTKTTSDTLTLLHTMAFG